MKKLALLLLLAPLALAACGGSSSVQPKLDPVAYVKHSAKKTAETSTHMEMTADMNMGPIALKLNGAGDFSYAQHDGSFSMNATVMGQNMNIDEILDGATIYMRSPMFASALPAGKTWVKVDLAQVAKDQGIHMESLMAQSPAENLKKLEAAGTVTKVGTETIDGAPTTEYEVTNLDASKLVQGAGLGKFEKQLGTPKYGPIHVWIGDENGYVYRESMSFSYGTPTGQSMKMSMVANLSKFGEPVHVSIPSASETADMSSLGGMNGIGA